MNPPPLPQPAAQTCPNCGAAAPEGARLCSHCGAALFVAKKEGCLNIVTQVILGCLTLIFAVVGACFPYVGGGSLQSIGPVIMLGLAATCIWAISRLRKRFK